MNSGNANIQHLHALYIALTGFDIRLDMARERVWFDWQKRGFTETDLRLVVAHIRKGIREQKRNPGALKFSNLIGNADFFEEDLAIAKAEKRGGAKLPLCPDQNNKASVLKASGRPPTEKPADAKHISEYLKSDEWQKLKQENGL